MNPTTMKVNNGQKFGTLPIPTREGYDFFGWVRTDNNIVLKVSSNTRILEKDHTLGACWIKPNEQGTLYCAGEFHNCSVDSADIITCNN